MKLPRLPTPIEDLNPIIPGEHPKFNYGPTLSKQAYERKVVSLQAHNISSDKTPTNIKKLQAQYLIEYKLGVDFPLEKRDKVIDIVARPTILNIAKSFMKNPLNPSHSHTSFQIKKLSKVLSDDEIMTLFEMKKEEIDKLKA